MAFYISLSTTDLNLLAPPVWYPFNGQQLGNGARRWSMPVTVANTCTESIQYQTVFSASFLTRRSQHLSFCESRKARRAPGYTRMPSVAVPHILTGQPVWDHRQLRARPTAAAAVAAATTTKAAAKSQQR